MTNLTKTTSSTEAAVVPLLTEPEMAELEQQIDVDSKAFKRVGLALIRIHEGRGYRLRGYKTFEDYCQARWDFTERQGRRLITAAQTAERVKEATGVEPASESVARWLSTVSRCRREPSRRITTVTAGKSTLTKRVSCQFSHNK